MQIEFDEIKALLPQKFPFLMLDRVISLEQGRKVVAIKNITGNEIFFLGHFPKKAVLPGALIIESMAQAAIILFQKSCGDQAVKVNAEKLFFFGSAKVRFFRPVVPGDQLQIEVTVIKVVSTGGLVDAIASVNGTVVAKAQLGFGVQDLTGSGQNDAENVIAVD
jgi:3-hydroxyacyl-[acyl-carrier-protein] dehydratase